MMELSVQYDEHAYLGGGYGIPKHGTCQTERAMKRVVPRRTWNRRRTGRQELAGRSELRAPLPVPLRPLFPSAPQPPHVRPPIAISYPDTTSWFRQTPT
jgi:hypothetical protein